MTRALMFPFVLWLCACASKPSLREPGLTADDGFFPIAVMGRPERAVFSADGHRLYVLISRRADHAGAQIYEFDPRSGHERRVTWQDGDIESFDVSPDERLVYASSTDELKERLDPSERPADEGQPTEIYLSDRFGGDIERLTSRPGFDGDVAFSSNGKDIVYSSKRGSHHVIVRMPSDRPSRARIVASRGPVRRFSPAFGQDGKAAWLQMPDQAGDPLTLRLEARTQPAFSTDKPLMGLRRAPRTRGWVLWESAPGSSRVFFMDEACEKTLWQGGQEVAWADVSAPPHRLALIARTSESAHLVLKELSDEAFACPEKAAADKLSP